MQIRIKELKEFESTMHNGFLIYIRLESIDKKKT